MTHHAKAPSAGSTEATGNSRGLFRRALPTRGASGRAKGTGAPSSRLRACLAVLALAITAFALTAAPASAAPPTLTTPTVSDISYATAHLEGKITNDAKFVYYQYEYSTDNSDWKASPGELLFEGPYTNKALPADLTNLKGGTKYFVRLVANNGFEVTDPPEGISAGPNPSFTTLAVDPPTIPGAVEATPIFSTSATATAKVTRPANADPAFDVNCRFEYITDAGYEDNVTNIGPGAGFTGATPAPCAENPIDKADLDAEPETTVTAALGCTSPVSEAPLGSCLEPSTDYHLRLVAENAAPGVVTKSASNFTTTAKVASPTVLSVDDATDIDKRIASVVGQVERPAGVDPALDTSCRFEYVTDAEFTANPPGDEFAGAGQAPCLGNNEVQSLTVAATAGQFRLTYNGDQFCNPGPNGSAVCPSKTSADLPFNATAVEVRDQIEGVIGTSGHSVSGGPGDGAGSSPYRITFLRGGFIDLGEQDQPELVVTDGTTPLAGTADVTTLTNGATAFEAVNGPPANQPKDVRADLSGLTPDTVYHLRLAAENGGGVDYKVAENTFKTDAIVPPTLAIDSITAVGYSGFTATVTIDPGNQGIRARVEYAPVGSEEWKVGPGFEASAGAPPLQKGFVLEEALTPGTTYQVRIGGSDLDEFANHYSPEPFPEITTLGTSTPPSAILDPVTDFTATSAHFTGTVNPNGPAEALDDEGKAAYKTKWHIECIPECKDVNGNEIGGTVEGDAGAQPIAGDAKRLEPSTHYDVKLIATNVLGTVESAQTFDTKKSPPTVKSALGASDGKGGYTLQGTVNPNNETVTDCKFEWGPNSSHLDFSADCSPMPSGGSKPVTVEAHLSGLNTGVTYHALLVVTYGAGAKADGGPQEFEATLDPPESCPNEQVRNENSSLALPECRGYEMVSPPGKEGFGASLKTFDGGDRVLYVSGAGNIARSGQGTFANNYYVAARSSAGWQTIPNLNGPSGSLFDAPNNFDPFGPPNLPREYSPDLLSSLWFFKKRGSPVLNFYLRRPDGTFALIGPSAVGGYSSAIGGTSDDLSHLLITPGTATDNPTLWGPGVYEYLGTGNEQPPRRVDVDNSGSPIGACKNAAYSAFNSRDGRVALVRVVGGCGGANPPAAELWARIDGTISIDVSASQCNRVDCNAPSEATFQAATPDGSRVFFTTKQQLLDADTDQTDDLYACDIPAGTPAPVGDDANPCSALRLLSAGDPSGAVVESVGTTSDNGATVLFTAKGVLAANEDALKEKAVAGDHNLYAWRTDAAHPDGQTTFVARLDSDDLSSGGVGPQSTPDGRYLVFTTANQLLDTDTDNARDLYRYDVEAGKLTRVSTNVFGVAGNGPFDAQVSPAAAHNPTTAISDDGQKIVFTTTEPLNLAVDNNDEPDVYLWTPGRVSLISTGSSGFAPKGNFSVSPVIDPSGQNIYFNSAQPLTPADGDDVNDVYDARIGGGFSFAPEPVCTGEKCQPGTTPTLPTPPSPANRANGDGNVKPPKPCPKGKVRNKKGKCVKKGSKKHSGKKHSGKKASHKQGGGK